MYSIQFGTIVFFFSMCFNPMIFLFESTDRDGRGRIGERGRKGDPRGGARLGKGAGIYMILDSVLDPLNSRLGGELAV